MPDEASRRRQAISPERTRRHLELSALINRVLDRGVVIAGDVIISVADVDLIQLNLTVAIASVETGVAVRRKNDADLPVLPPRSGG